MAGGREERPGWRTRTFADGVRSLTLLGPLDAARAGRLWTRISELPEKGARRLVVDASALESTGEEPALLAAVLAGHPARCQIVVITTPGSSLMDLLPVSVGTARSLTDAHRQLAAGIVRHHVHRPAPAARLAGAERRTLATRQSLRWARRAAREGDYERALTWLQMVERIEGRLPPEWNETRAIWTAAWTAQIAYPCRPRPGQR